MYDRRRGREVTRDYRPQPVTRVLAVFCGALLAAGVVGAVSVNDKRHTRPGSTVASAKTGGSAVPTTGRTPPTSSTLPTSSTPPAGSAALASGLVQPSDMGGYYHPSPQTLLSFLGSAPCLAALQPSPAQSGRAVQALVTADSFAVPQIFEVVSSYPTTRAASVYGSVTAVLDSCRSFSFAFNGIQQRGRLAAASLPAVGDKVQAWSVPFSAGGDQLVLDMAAVLQGDDVFFIGWADRAAGSDPIMGSFQSTVSLAIGKEA
jgi:hypothetical protein